MFPHVGAWSPYSVLLPALIFGIKHALEADHLSAVSAIISQHRNLRSTLLVGLAWGAGHMLALLGIAAAVLILRVDIPAQLALAAELLVSLYLVGAGVQALWRVWRGEKLHVHLHAHGGHVHWHPHFHGEATAVAKETHHATRLVRRPLLFGLLHGLGGSAALMLIVVAQTPSATLGLLYVGVFAAGALVGMIGMSLVVGVPLQQAQRRFAYAQVTIRTLTALISVSIGASVAYEIAVNGGWLV